MKRLIEAFQTTSGIETNEHRCWWWCKNPGVPASSPIRDDGQTTGRPPERGKCAMRLSGITPILRIFDEEKAKEFYVGFLGFRADWEHRFGDNFPLYMQISKDDCTIHLSEHHGDCTPGGALRIETEDVSAFNRVLLQKEYRYAKPGVESTPWNTHEMTITDPFGNRLIFFEKQE